MVTYDEFLRNKLVMANQRRFEEELEAAAEIAGGGGVREEFVQAKLFDGDATA